MRTYLLLTILSVLVLVTFQFAAEAQPQSSDWFRVASDDGEFSIEVPQSYRYYFSKEGFSQGRFNASGDFQVTDMRMLTGYANGSLLSFEIYKAKKGAVEAFFEGDTYKKENARIATTKENGYVIRQFAEPGDGYFLVRKYFYSKNNIYVLTAASRDGESPEMRRFLDSLIFTPTSGQAADLGTTKLSSLRVTDITIATNYQLPKNPAPVNANAGAATQQDKKEALTILRKPAPSYVDAARMKNVKGTMRFRVNFSADGFIPHIDVISALPEGLLRQALFAAIRIKFLPKLKDGKPVSVDRVVEYGFDIY